MSRRNIVEFCIDVAARKEAGQALRESEERFRSMAAVLELAPVLVRPREGSQNEIRAFLEQHGPACFGQKHCDYLGQ